MLPEWSNRFVVRITMRAFFALIASAVILPVSAQEKMSFRVADSLSYHHYESGNWNELVRTGNEAIRQGHDYYYLRMRTGIAYYMLGHFRAAATHFGKALDFNHADRTAIEYLQSSYLLGGMNAEAAYLNKRFPGIIESPGLSSKVFSNLFLLSGISLSGSEGKLQGLNIAGKEGIYGEVNLSGDMLINQAGFNYSPQPHWLWYAGYSNIRLERYQRIVAGGMDTVNHTYTLKQHAFYANFPIRPATGWQIIPALHLMLIRDNAILMHFDNVAQEYMQQTGAAPSLHYVFSCKILKEMPYLSLGPAFGYSRLNENEQLQLSFDMNVYPFANLNLYTFSGFVTTYENGRLYPHFKQVIGGRVTNWLWLQGGFQGGEIRNAHHENGLLVFNMAGRIRTRSSATVYIPGGEKFNFSLEYNFIQQQDDYLEYTDNVNYTLNPVQYNNHQILGGIKWKL